MGLVLLQARHVHAQSPIPSADTVVIQTSEGTGLSFDLTPDGKTIVFDLLGQLWRLPAEGGLAVPFTDAIREYADDSDPSISPNGASVAFRSDRSEGRGIWLQSLVDGTLRQLTDSTAFANNEHDSPVWSADGGQVAYVNRWQLRIRDVLTDRDDRVQPPELPPFVSDPHWSMDGRQILVVAGAAYLERGLWEIDVAGNRAESFGSVTGVLHAPQYSHDGTRAAYFTEDVPSGINRLWVHTRGAPQGRLVAEGEDLSPLRVRWSPDDLWLYYSSAGKLWRISSEGGTATVIPFAATLSFARPSYSAHAVPVPRPGETIEARGFGGLAISPDARRYAMIALGTLWTSDIGGTPRATTDVPGTATGLSWSPDGTRVVWSAGRGGAEDLFVTEVASGITRQVTALPGRESAASWSPDARWITFVHWAKPESDEAPWAFDVTGSRVRMIRADLGAPALLPDSRDLGSFFSEEVGHDRLSWNPTSSAVLSFANRAWPVAGVDSARALWLGVSGGEDPAPLGAYRPSFLQVGRDGSLTYVEDGLLQRRSSWDSEPRVLSEAVAMHPSVADNGTVLFASHDGLRVIRSDGREERLGWPLSGQVAAAPPPLLIRNVRIFDGSTDGLTDLRDLLVEHGRIARIDVPGRIRIQGSGTEIDAAGRFMVPGLIDVHTHLSDAAVPPAALYFGVTTVRDMGSPLALAAGWRDAIATGAMEGPRVLVSGLTVYPAPTTGGLTADMLWMPRDSAGMERTLSVLVGFGAAHVKLRFPLSTASGAKFVRLARTRGLTVSGHCASPLPLVVAGISGQEHLDGQCGSRGPPTAHDDWIQLYRAGGLWGVPTIFLHGAHLRAVRDTIAVADTEVGSFLSPRLRLTMLRNDPDGPGMFALRQADEARRGASSFHQVGLPIALGSDAPEFPDAVHGELAELVTAGLSPAEALRSATSTAADVLGIAADVGRIEIGKIADLLLLEANPLQDIDNTRRVWRVIQGGRVVDRSALRTIAENGS